MLLILAGVTLVTLTGKNGILGKANKANNETDKKTAEEKLNLKITNIQMDNYIEKQQMPTLKEVSISLGEDEEIEYVVEKSKVATTEYDVPSQNPSAIYTKLNEYPYEFEIDSKLRLAAVDGVKIEDNEENEKLDELEQKIQTLETILSSQQTIITQLQTEVQKTIIDYSASLEGEKIGGTWYDGTPMYELSFPIILPATTENGTGNRATIDLQKYNIKEAYVADGFFQLENGAILPIAEWITLDASKTYGASGYYNTKEKNLIILNSNTYYNGNKGYVTIHYNKNQ